MGATPPGAPRPAPSSRGRLHPRNLLNGLTGSEWLRFTRSWFVHNPPPRSQAQVRHPAKYPEGLVAEFVRFFTREGEAVLDPFMGVGSTPLAAAALGRRGLGLELNRDYYDLACRQAAGQPVPPRLFHHDAARIGALGLEPVHFVMTSPPYWNMLSLSRGNVRSVHQEREARGLDTVYSQGDPADLGQISGYPEFLGALVEVFREVVGLLIPGRYLVVVLQNLRSPEGRMVPLAWDLARELDRFMIFKGERIWCQENKRLGIWGYPSELVLNVHHHYCLVFRKP